MGKKKTKVKWTAVESLPLKYSSRNELDGQQEIRGRDAALPPRFERKAALEKNMVYYDGQFCETEELPNGFVKVRSKHLDVLFKRDFYTKKMERIFNSRYKQTSNDVLNSKMAEAQDEMANYSAMAEAGDEMANYSCHNSSDGSIIYNIDHLLVSSNVSFEMSTNPAANQSANTSLETDDVINDLGLHKESNDVIQETPSLVENMDDAHHDSGFADTLLNHPSDKTRHDSGFMDSSFNIPSQSLVEETAPSWPNQFLSSPGLYVFIPSGNELIPCEEVFVSPPRLRDPRCTCAPPTRLFLSGAGQNNVEPDQAGQSPAPGPGQAGQSAAPGPGQAGLSAAPGPGQAGQSAAPGPGYGFHLHGTGAVQNDPFFNYSYNNLNMIPTDHQPQFRYGPFAPNCRFIPFHLPHQDPSGVDEHNLHKLSFHMDGNNIHNSSFHMDGHNLLKPFPQMYEHEAGPHFDGSEPLLTSEPNYLSSKPNTYQLFSVDEKIHPVFGFSTSPCNDDFQSQINLGHQGGSRKVIEPDHDWIDQLELIEKNKNLSNQANNSTSWNMEPYFKQEHVKAQVEVPSLKSPIPGLPLESLVRKKAQKKKKRRKRKSVNDVKNIDSSDETGTGVEAKLEGKRSTRNQSNEKLDSDKLESHFELSSEKRALEIELSDALASSLVDPLAHYSSHNKENINVQEVLVSSMADLIFDIADENDGKEKINVQEGLVNSMADLIFDIADENEGREHIVAHQTINDERDTDVHRTIKDSKDVDMMSNSNDSFSATAELCSRRKPNSISPEEFPFASMKKKDQNLLKKTFDNVIRTGDTADVKNEIEKLLEELITAAVKYEGDTPKVLSAQITGYPGPKIPEAVNTMKTKSKDKKSKYIDSLQNASKTSLPHSVNIVNENVAAELQCSEESSNHSTFPTKAKGAKAKNNEKNNSQILTSSNKEKAKKARKNNSSFVGTADLLEVGGTNKGNENRLRKEDIAKSCNLDEKTTTNNPFKRTNVAKRNGKKEKTKFESTHRVIIDDSKVEIIYSRQVLSPAPVLAPERLKIVQTDSCDDNIFVDSLGLGMDRGCMTQGRLSPSHLIHRENLFRDMGCGGGQCEKKNGEIPAKDELGEGNEEIGLD